MHLLNTENNFRVTKRKDIMSTEKAPNYSEQQVQELLANVPFNNEVAKTLAKEMGKVPASIVAKITRLSNDETVRAANPSLPEGKWYVSKPAYVPKTGKVTVKKSDRVSAIETILEVDKGSLVSLAKAGVSDLERLQLALNALLGSS